MGRTYQLDMAHERVTSVFAKGDAPVVDHELDADEEILIALGYRQDFKRKFTVWSSFCVSFSVLGLLPSVAATLGFSLGYLLVCQFQLTQDMLELEGWCGDGSSQV